MIDKTLEQLGLNVKEVSIYTTSLRLGPSSVRKIAAEAGINRGTTYDILKSLARQGLVSYYHQHKHQYFIAEDPEKLNDLVEEKYHKMLETRGRIQAIIPQLKSIHNNARGKPIVKFYEGHNGAKTILQDVIDTCKQDNIKEYYVYSSSVIRNFIYKLYPNFSNDRVEAGIKVKVIAIGPGGEKRGLDERKWLTQEERVAAYTILYDGNIAMISLNSDGKPMGVVIKDKNFYEAQKLVFDFTWSKL